VAEARLDLAEVEVVEGLETARVEAKVGAEEEGTVAGAKATVAMDASKAAAEEEEDTAVVAKATVVLDVVRVVAEEAGTVVVVAKVAVVLDVPRKRVVTRALEPRMASKQFQ